MGIVHHSNYVRYCEEARVAWAINSGLIDQGQPRAAAELAVLSVSVQNLKPLKFPDSFEIKLQVKLELAKLVFEYKIFSGYEMTQLYAEARTKHVSIDENLKSKRPSDKVKNIIRNEIWTETWLLNL